MPTRARRRGPGTLPPLLAVHDRLDRQARYDDALAVVRAWPEPELMTTEGLGHRRILHDAAVVDAVTAFVAQRARTATG